MKMRTEYTCPLELVHDMIKGKWKPIILWRLRLGATSLAKLERDMIYNLISDICISMKAVDYLDMPECVYNRVEVIMSEKEMALYEQLERDMLLPFSDGDIDAVNAAALSNKLLQMADGAVYDENGNVKHIHDRKLEALEDLVEAANGKPVLIAYWYKHDLDRLKKHTGAVELDTAEDMRKWNAGEIPVAAIHPASAGHGLNLQAGGSTLVWFGLTWSLELYQQMNARLWRQGQEETVVIHHLIAKGTLDERVMAALEKKDCGQSALVDAVKARIAVVAYPTYCTSKNSYFMRAEKELANTLVATDYKDPPVINDVRTASGKDIFGTISASMGSKQWLGNQEAFSGDYDSCSYAVLGTQQDMDLF
ncbi:hypothetical protein C809_04519 [Lachnospiraceae bacterium MD335]|nr:hypothetical protein C809_04519 [Lachnospiraceae bacterium MD335]